MTLADETGLWCEIARADCAGRPAIFLDRDGVIVEDVDYLAHPGDLRMIAGSAEAVARCNRLGIPVVVVSNQSGVGRGFYGWSDFTAVQAALAVTLERVARISTPFWLAPIMPTRLGSIVSPITRGASQIPACCGRRGSECSSICPIRGS